MIEKMINDKYYVYKIKNTQTNRTYIGATNNPMSRFDDHLCSSLSPIYKDIKQYGTDIFDFKIIEECPYNLINEREQYWVNHYCQNSYNKQINTNYMENTPYNIIYSQLMNCIELINKGYQKEDIKNIMNLTYVQISILYHYALQEHHRIMNDWPE